MPGFDYNFATITVAVWTALANQRPTGRANKPWG